MQLQYTGKADRRIVQDHAWAPGEVREVDEALGAMLLEKHASEFASLDEGELTSESGTEGTDRSGSPDANDDPIEDNPSLFD